MRTSCFKKEVLVSTPSGVVYRCACGTYHVEIDAATFHFDPLQFGGVARLFKLALGVVAARKETAVQMERPFSIKHKVIHGGMQ